MPDAGDFDQGSRDRPSSAEGMPAGWGDAFASLPQQAPAPDGWQRLQARLPAAPARERTRWPLWLATAASLALVVAIPLRMQSTGTPDPVPLAATASPEPVITQATTDTGVEPAPTPLVPAPLDTADATTPTTASTTITRNRKPRAGRHVDPSARPIRTAAQPADTTRIASSETPQAPASDVAAADLAPDAPDALPALYAQSAQLESLLAMARDDRVSTGTAAALTDTLNARMASIDAALAQSELGPQDRADLWGERIDTLRQLVGIETTQRLYAARGQHYEAALVSID